MARASATAHQPSPCSLDYGFRRGGLRGVARRPPVRFWGRGVAVAKLWPLRNQAEKPSELRG